MGKKKQIKKQKKQPLAATPKAVKSETATTAVATATPKASTAPPKIGLPKPVSAAKPTTTAPAPIASRPQPTTKAGIGHVGTVIHQEYRDGTLIYHKIMTTKPDSKAEITILEFKPPNALPVGTLVTIGEFYTHEGKLSARNVVAIGTDTAVANLFALISTAAQEAVSFERLARKAQAQKENDSEKFLLNEGISQICGFHKGVVIYT